MTLSHPKPQDDLPSAATRRLLAMSLTEPDRPIDLVLERLAGPRAGALIADAESLVPTLKPERVRAALLEGEGGLERLHAIKSAAKLAMSNAQTDDDAATAALLYFLTLAAALAHERRFISGQAKTEIMSALESLGWTLQGPYAHLVQAAQRAGTSSSD